MSRAPPTRCNPPEPPLPFPHHVAEPGADAPCGDPASSWHVRSGAGRAGQVFMSVAGERENARHFGKRAVNAKTVNRRSKLTPEVNIPRRITRQNQGLSGEAACSCRRRRARERKINSIRLRCDYGLSTVPVERRGKSLELRADVATLLSRILLSRIKDKKVVKFRTLDWLHWHLRRQAESTPIGRFAND